MAAMQTWEKAKCSCASAPKSTISTLGVAQLVNQVKVHVRAWHDHGLGYTVTGHDLHGAVFRADIHRQLDLDSAPVIAVNHANAIAQAQCVFEAMAAAAGVALALLAGAGTAQARDVNWSIGVNSPGVSVGVSNGYGYGYPAYVAPAPVYVAPRPIYYAPPPPPPPGDKPPTPPGV